MKKLNIYNKQKIETPHKWETKKVECGSALGTPVAR